MNLLRKSELKVIYRTEVQGQEFGLGHVRELSSHVRSSEMNTSINFAWVGLEPGEELAFHYHNRNSYVIIQKGVALAYSPNEQMMNQGDFLAIPDGVWHGFKMADDSGFEALAFSFNDSGLFENVGTTIFDKDSLEISKKNAQLVKKSEKCYRDYDRILPKEFRARWIHIKDGKQEKVDYSGPTFIINFEGRCKVTGEHQEVEMLTQDILFFDKPDSIQFSTLRKSTLFTLELIDPEAELEGLS